MSSMMQFWIVDLYVFFLRVAGVLAQEALCDAAAFNAIRRKAQSGPSELLTAVWPQQWKIVRDSHGRKGSGRLMITLLEEDTPFDGT